MNTIKNLVWLMVLGVPFWAWGQEQFAESQIVNRDGQNIEMDIKVYRYWLTGSRNIELNISKDGERCVRNIDQSQTSETITKDFDSENQIPGLIKMTYQGELCDGYKGTVWAVYQYLPKKESNDWKNRWATNKDRYRRSVDALEVGVYVYEPTGVRDRIELEYREEFFMRGE